MSILISLENDKQEQSFQSPTKFASFSTAVTLKIRSRSPKSNLYFVMSQLYIDSH